jgi:hypothetical protein
VAQQRRADDWTPRLVYGKTVEQIREEYFRELKQDLLGENK